MKWIEPENSKTKVKKVGDKLVQGELSLLLEGDLVEYFDTLDVFANWRASHAYPMHTILTFLRTKAKKIDKKAVVVQRLKREPSITAKLIRFKGMNLSRMQDIAGCRAVLSTTNQVQKLAKSLKDSRTRNILHKEDNYIEKPKPSGYRGIHLVYKYRGQKECYHNLFVEIQLRSKIQHSWATSVEVVGTFTRQALKASIGTNDWLDFFRYISAEFAKLENDPVCASLQDIDTNEKVLILSQQLLVAEKLKAFTATTMHLHKTNKKKQLYILILDTKKKRVSIKSFSSVAVTAANSEYSGLELKYANDDTKDVVLVSAKSIMELRKAYPNYFADTREFIKNLNKVLGI